ncbi:MAG: aminotransferase class I/II-fold pyridoxal phosphate-dependent enzyme [Acidobacteria bacterium]|nr:aminotransferase class I/II-fold pyridoxal phosphate-dependent enzyme [Acidobacteriota bacterium]
MSLSRRSFVQTLGVGGAGLWITARGREASLFAQGIQPLAGPPPSVILSSNENPLGCHKDVLAAIKGAAFPEAGRYPFATAAEVTELLAKKHGVKPENVLLGSGSTQILRTCTHVFTSKTAGLTATIPAYEECADYARLMGHPITGVKLDANLKMDLDAMQQGSKGAGLVFFCNPNNPVATAVSGSDTRTYLDTLMKASPTTTVLVDEAYFEYGTMPGYETMIPLAVTNPRVVVARTFSKCFGMAGLRMGYAVAHRDTIKKMADWDSVGNISVMALQGAKAALAVPDSWVKDEQKRNEAARNFTQKWFADRGYTPTDSQTNFMFINVKRPAREFREACLKEGVLIGRDFPPYEKTHVRISIGTMEEMQKSVQVFEHALAQPSKAAA